MDPIAIVLASFPLGISLQYLGATLALIVGARRAAQFPLAGLLILKRFAWPMGLAAGFILWLMVATALNDARHLSPWRGGLGLLPWLLIPWVLLIVQATEERQDLRRYLVLLAVIAVLWGTVAWSQYFIGWRILGAQLATDGSRPRGFYSHPLTFAYAALIPWPLAVACVVETPKKWIGWAMALGLGSILVLTHSRTVQSVAALVLVAAVLAGIPGRRRWIASAFCVAVLALVLSTPNTIGDRFRKTWSAEGVDRHQAAYLDDRLAFWAAHGLMIRERPLVGHGFDLDKAYRTPYYQRLGLDDFTKKYEAHNMYVQILADGGLIGLSLFLAWVFWHIRLSIRIDIARSKVPVATLTWLSVLLAGMTQNSFQDAEVRMGITLLVAGTWAYSRRAARPR
jgi:O-antigen ligase